MRYNTHEAIARLKSVIDVDQARQDQRLDLIEDSYDYGGILLQTPVPFPDIVAAYQTLLADSAMISSPLGVVQDFANNGLIFTDLGIYLINASFAMEHADSNQGRTFSIRLHNVDDDVTGAVSVIGVGRNVEVTNWSSSLLFEVLNPSQLNKLVQLQVGDASSTFTGCTQNSLAFSAVKVDLA